MEKDFLLRIYEIDNEFYSGPCESLQFPAYDGMYGIMAGHSDFMAAIVPGIIYYRVPGEGMKTAAISDGMIKVTGDEVLILADAMEHPEEIDEERVRRSIERAKQELQYKKSVEQHKLAEARLSRAMMRLKLKDMSIND